jgi:hypothetical protein
MVARERTLKVRGRLKKKYLRGKDKEVPPTR